MRRVDDSVEILDPEHAEVGDGKAAALILMRGQLSVAGAGGQILHLGGQGRQRFLMRVLEHRREQPTLDGDGHGHI